MKVSHLLLLLVLYLPCITGGQQDVKYIPLGGILKLLPDTNSVTESITGILWKHGPNKVAEWDEVFGPDVDYYGTYRDRAALNKDTGELVINNMNIKDGGIYSVEINGRLQSKTHNIKVIRHSLVKTVGDDAVLPCDLDPTTDPNIDLADLTIKWFRPDLQGDQHVYYQRNGAELDDTTNPSYKGRTSLFQDEVKKGNVSLKLTRVKLSDKGIYTCFIDEFKMESTVHLTVGRDSLVSSPGRHSLVSSPGRHSLDSSSVGHMIIIIISIIIISIIGIIGIGVLFYKKQSILIFCRKLVPSGDERSVC